MRGWAEEGRPSLLLWVLEYQSRGVPHLHFVLGHTTALEKAFAREFFRGFEFAAYALGLGHTSSYERALLEHAASAETCTSLQPQSSPKVAVSTLDADSARHANERRCWVKADYVKFPLRLLPPAHRLGERSGMSP